MADPVSAGLSIGSAVLGGRAKSRQAYADANAKIELERQSNEAKYQNYLIQQNKEAMASDRQNEKLADQLYNVTRSNEFIEQESMKQLFGNAAELHRQGKQVRTDLVAKSRAVQEANEVSAMTRGLENSALGDRLQRLNNKELIKATQDTIRTQEKKQEDLLQRRSAQLASRQSEAIAFNTWQPGRAPTLYDNSALYRGQAKGQSRAARAGMFGKIVGSLF